MTRDPFAEWRIDERDYPAAGSNADKLRFLLRYAILAPSGHNTQPWLFRINGDLVELWADRKRALPVVDPQDRELAISCGAAAGILRLAMGHFGHRGEIELLPDSNEPDLLARVALGESCHPHAEGESAFRAIVRRRTTRRRFTGSLPEGLQAQLRDIAAEEMVELALLTEPRSKAAVAALVSEGDKVQFADQRFRRELASWVHSRRKASRDGMSGANFGMPDVLSAAGGLVIKTFDMGNGIAAKDEEIAANAPALIVVATRADDEENWIRAGIAHVRMVLSATAAGLTAAYLNQPIEVDRLRPRLKAAAGLSGIPQLLFRIGQGPEVPPAVRRPVEEVLLPAA